MGPFLILLVIALQSQSPNLVSKTAEAAYIQTGMQEMMIKKERELVSQELRAYLGPGLTLTKTLIEQRISYEWRF